MMSTCKIRSQSIPAEERAENLFRGLLPTSYLILLLGARGSIWGEGSVGQAKGQGRFEGGVFPSEWRSTIVKVGHDSFHTYPKLQLG